MGVGGVWGGVPGLTDKQTNGGPVRHDALMADIMDGCYFGWRDGGGGGAKVIKYHILSSKC